MINKNTRQVVLITGCGSGVGHATALACAKAGYITYATGRDVNELDDLRKAGCQTLQLDVADEASRLQAVNTIVKKHGAIDILINNAGYGQMGPLEEITPEQIDRQFETNVFGALRLCQLVLPGMRAKRQGTILTVGSVGGLMTTPFMGAYHMSKYAVESMVDALRVEISPFGIRIILLEPAGMKTNFGNASLTSVDSGKTSSPYGAVQKRVSAITAKAYMGSRLLTPEYVANIIVKAIGAQRPKTRYKIGLQAHIMPCMFRLMGDRMRDRIWQKVIAPK
jgi:NAD(P)-dependent dehydrogenase (short-subunit alcohol dehydrogenase family)